MMQVRCQRCGQMTTLGREAIAQALAEAQQKQEQYYTFHCIRCRHAVKIQVSELRRRLPAGYTVPESPAASAPPAEPSAAPEADEPAA